MSKAAAVYLLLGPEIGEKDAFVRRLVTQLGKQAGGSPEIHRFYGFDVELAEVLAVLRNGALFSPHRIAILGNAELLTRKRDLDLLAEYCNHPAADATLLLLSEEVTRIDRRVDRMVPKDNRVVFWELFENQKMGWIQNFFGKRRVEIEPRAATFLLEMVENNTKQLQDTCEKLTLFFGEGSRIGHEDVEKILYHSKEENVFTLFDKIAARDFPGSLEVLGKILLSREADPVQLLGGLLSQIRRLLSLKRLLDGRYSPEEAFANLNLRGKKMQKVYSEGARRYSLEELQALVVLVARFDVRLRSLKTALAASLLQLFLYYTVIRGGRS
jgi:DNA polymerase-3 subunit delta